MEDPQPSWRDVLRADTSQEMELCVQVSLERTLNVVRFERTVGRFVQLLALRYNACDSDLAEALRDVPESNKNLKNSLSQLRAHFKGVSNKYVQHVYQPLYQSILADEENAKKLRSDYAATRNTVLEHRKQFQLEKQRLQQCIELAEVETVRWYQAYDVSVQDDDEDNDNDSGAVDRSDPNHDSLIDVDTDGVAWETVLRRIGKHDPAQTERTIKHVRGVLKQHENILAVKARYDQSVRNTRAAFAATVDSFQDMEQSKLSFVTESVMQSAMNRHDVVLDLQTRQLTGSPTRQQSERDGNLAVTLEKKRKDIMANLFQQKSSSAYEPGQGVFEAETLGLPTEIGELRDRLKSKFADHQHQLDTIKIVSSILDKLIIAAEQLAEGIKNLSREGGDIVQGSAQSDSHKAQQQQQTPSWKLIASSVGHRTCDVTEAFMQAFVAEAQSVMEWTERMRHAQQRRINPFLLTVAKQIQLELESDDVAWKMLCNAARKQSKVETKYKQTLLDNERIRERARSTDSVSRRADSDDFDAQSTSSAADSTKNNSGNGSSRPGNKLTKAFARLPSLQSRTNSSVSDSLPNESNADVPSAHKKVSKAFGNMLSAIPNSANNAMKILNADGGLVVGGKREADETKERQNLDSADAVKSRAMTSYKSFTEERLEKILEYERAGSTSIQSAWDAMLSGLEVIPATRKRMDETGQQIKKGSVDLARDSEAWLTTVRSRVGTKTSSPQGDDLFSLSLRGLDTSTGSAVVDSIRKLSSVEQAVPDELVEIIQILKVEHQDKLQLSPAARQATPVPVPLAAPSIPVPSAMMRRQSSSGVTSEGGSNIANATGAAESAEVRAARSFSETFFDKEESDRVPKLLSRYNCSYRPKEKGISLTTPLNGMIYISEESIHFAGSNDKKLAIAWSDVESVKKEKSFIGGENALLVSYKSHSGETFAFVVGKLQHRDLVYNQIQEMLTKVQSSVDNQKDVSEEPSVAVISPDVVVNDKMVRIFERTLFNVTVERFYSTIFSEGNRTNAGPFYRNFLAKEGCFDLSVEDWEFADDGRSFEAAWCGETYTQKRMVTFKFNRKTHLYIGPPVAQVNQLQYCRIEGSDRCVVAMVLTFDGIPYADCFSVHARWAMRRDGTNNLKVEVGIQVEFRKKTLLASQIKAGTIAETTPVHQRLFEEAKAALGVETPTEAESDDEDANDTDRAAVIEQQASYEGMLNILNGLLSSLPVDRSFLLGAGTVLGVMLVRSWLFRGGSTGIRDSVSAVEFRQMREQIDGMQQTLQAIQAMLNDK